MGIFQKIRQRRFFQIVASYLAAGWIGVEVVDQLVDRGRLPDVAYSIALIWYAAGLGAALFIAWNHGEKGAQRAPLSEVVALTLIGLAAVGLTASRVEAFISKRVAVTAAEASRLDLHRIAVLYFQDLSPGKELTPVADGFTESLIDELSTVQGLDVQSRGAVASYRGTSDPQKVGRALQAGTLVTGSIEPLGKEVRISVHLLDGESGVEVRRISFDLPSGELLAAEDSIVARSAGMLREWLGEEVRLRVTRRDATTLAAWLLYQRGEKARKDAEAAIRDGNVEATGRAFDVADSLLAEAQRSDLTWAAPAVLRGSIAYRRSRTAESMAALLEWDDIGLKRVAAALELDPNEPAGLEVRGTLRYWRYLQNQIPDPDKAQALFDSARADLERAVKLDPTLASAHSILSHLYLNVPDLTAAVIEARRAYEEDAYLDNADAVVWRLVTTTYNLEQFVEMRRWVEIGQRRFPDNYRFVDGAIQLMTTSGANPNPEAAWSLLARLDSLAPRGATTFYHVRAELAVGGVLARAGLVDSARAVLQRAHEVITPEVDPSLDLYAQEAYMWCLAGEEDQAINVLKLIAALHPGATFGGPQWWWRKLRDNPRWTEVAPAG